MENIELKAAFLKNEYVKLLSTIDPATKGAWGKMNFHQMVEHMSYSFRQGNGKDVYVAVTPAEHIPKMQAFLMSEKPFKENTPNVLIGDDTVPEKNTTLKEALDELQSEIDHFFEVYKEEGKSFLNPFFGTLNYEMQVQLLHKHAWHHLKQFGVNG